jgi:hypothetical protein
MRVMIQFTDGRMTVLEEVLRMDVQEQYERSQVTLNLSNCDIVTKAKDCYIKLPNEDVD